MTSLGRCFIADGPAFARLQGHEQHAINVAGGVQSACTSTWPDLFTPPALGIKSGR